MKKAILCVSFGTSVDAARDSITAVENVLRGAAPDRLFARAFTSSIIRRILAERGETILSVSEALEVLWKQEVREVLVQPTHILYGNEYDKIKAEASAWQERFDSLQIGKPLLADTADLKAVTAALSETYPPCDDEMLVLFGHGTDHFANAVYPALQTAFRLAGREDVLVGTVEGWPAYEDVCCQLKRSGRKQIHLVPLMLVAGDHAMHDMAGSEADSWASRLTEEGYMVRCTIQGLGQLPKVQALYRDHLESMLS